MPRFSYPVVAVLLVLVVTVPPSQAATGPTVTVGDGCAEPNETTTVTIRLSDAPDGVAGYDLTVSLGNSATGTITSVSVPSQFRPVSTDVDAGGGQATVRAADFDDQLDSGASPVLVRVTIRGSSRGTTAVTANVDALDDDDGDRIQPTTSAGQLRVRTTCNPIVENPPDSTATPTESQPTVETPSQPTPTTETVATPDQTPTETPATPTEPSATPTATAMPPGETQSADPPPGQATTDPSQSDPGTEGPATPTPSSGADGSTSSEGGTSSGSSGPGFGLFTVVLAVSALLVFARE